jgi:hypothetical protein
VNLHLTNHFFRTVIGSYSWFSPLVICNFIILSFLEYLTTSFNHYYQLQKLNNKMIFFFRYHIDRKEDGILFLSVFCYVMWSLGTLEPCECRRWDAALHQRNGNTEIKKHVCQYDEWVVLYWKFICTVLNDWVWRIKWTSLLRHKSLALSISEHYMPLNSTKFGQPYNTFWNKYCTDNKPFLCTVDNW